MRLKGIKKKKKKTQTQCHGSMGKISIVRSRKIWEKKI